MAVVKNRNAKIERGYIELTVPYKDSELTFIYPAKGQNTYTEVGNEIEQNGLIRSTSEKTIHLVHSAYFDEGIYKDEPEFKNIKEIIKNRWFWEFTRNLWTSEGVYVYDNGDGKPKDKDYLEAKLSASDKRVKFVPKGFKLGEQTSKELEENPYIIARYGDEGAEKLAEVAGQFRNNPPYIYSLTDVRNSEQRVSALGCNSGGGLGVGGGGFDDCGGGYALGVRSSGEATHTE